MYPRAHADIRIAFPSLAQACSIQPRRLHQSLFFPMVMHGTRAAERVPAALFVRLVQRHCFYEVRRAATMVATFNADP